MRYNINMETKNQDTQKITISRFYMWRAIVAMAHADGVVTPQEISFIHNYLKEMDLSSEHLAVIKQDLSVKQNVTSLFSCITEYQDRLDFFALARALSWCDGDFHAQEKKIIHHLEALMLQNWKVVEESRKVCHEVELCNNQWKFKTARSQSLLGFLDDLKTVAT